MISTTLQVAPKLAKKWLALLAHNQRPLNRGHVNRLIMDMKAGKFVPSVDPIVFDKTGKLVNGQHRLTACVEAEYTMEALVVKGVSTEAIATIDTGRSRSASDQMLVLRPDLAGKRRICDTMSAIWTTVYRYAAGLSVWAVPVGKNEKAHILIEDGLLQDAGEFAQQYGQKKNGGSIISPGIAGAVYYVLTFAGYPESEIQKFLDTVAFGYGLQPKTIEDRVRRSILKGNKEGAAGSQVIFERFRHILYAFVVRKSGKQPRFFVPPDFPEVPKLDKKMLREKIGVKENNPQQVRAEGL